LDRDGVINKKMPEDDYVKEWEEFIFLPGVFEAVSNIKGKGYLIIIITNQRCIARNIIDEDTLRGIHEKMVSEIQKHGGHIDSIYFCPHNIDDNCKCRKPEIGMISNALADFKKVDIEIDLEKSYMVGDSEKDIKAGNSAGVKTIRIGKKISIADFASNSLLDAVKFLQ